MARRLVSVCLGLLTLLALARTASAQTYVWTDERGVVHAAAEPGEVPEKYRAKSVQDAQRPHSNVTVLPPPEPAAPDAEAAEPTAPAPMKPGLKPKYLPPAKPAAPGAGPEAAQTTPPADNDEPKKKKGLGEPAPGFEWNCTPDPDGGEPKCEQFEKRSSKRARHAAARAQARKQLGVDPEDENDPEVKEQLQREADKAYEKSTRKPDASERPSDDEESPEESED